MVLEVKSRDWKYYWSILKVFSVCIGYAPFVLPFIHNAVPSCCLYVLVCENTGVLIKLLGFFGSILKASLSATSLP